MKAAMNAVMMRPTEYSPVCTFNVTNKPTSGKKLLSACGVWVSFYHSSKLIEPTMHAAQHDPCPLCSTGQRVLAAEPKTQYAGRRRHERRHLPQ